MDTTFSTKSGPVRAVVQNTITAEGLLMHAARAKAAERKTGVSGLYQAPPMEVVEAIARYDIAGAR